MTISPPISANPRATLVGNNIRMAREAKGITQLALGHLVGWAGEDAGAQICRFEGGKMEPRLSTLQRIAGALGVTLESLLVSQPKKKQSK